MDAPTSPGLPIVLALEPVAGAPPQRMTLSRDEAAELAQWVARDLIAVVPLINRAKLVVAGALFDPVELLRPGFPVWATLDELARRVPADGVGNVIAFGHHEGRMPAPQLQPAALHAEGPMRLLPISLLPPADLAEDLSAELEVQLVGRGEAAVPTADWLMRTFDMRLEHLRYFTRGDLLALTCVQYEHVNLAPLWMMVETALLTPERHETTMSSRGLPLCFVDGVVLVQSPAQWLSSQSGEMAQRAHDFAGIVFELRQYAALLDAHRIPLRLQDSGMATGVSDGYLLETLAAVQVQAAPPCLFAHEAPGLGVVAVTVAQPAGAARPRVLAHGYPLQPSALGPLLQRLADDYDIPSELQALGRVVLDQDGQLAAPPAVVH